MDSRLFTQLVSVISIGVLCVSLFVQGGMPEEGASSADAMKFIKLEIPELHAEIQIVLSQMPEMAVAIRESVSEIQENHLRFSEMSSELANIYLTIKKREFQNQIMAEKIQTLADPQKRSAEFKRLADHMNVTFDLHLRLVKGELAWLEREVDGLRDLIVSEGENKALYLREDIVSLLLKNDPLLRISISGLGEKQTQAQQAELKKLIESLPQTNSEKR